MEFLTDTALHDAIVAIARESGARCAVAFWGKGAETRVGDNARIICNLRMGGTNPAVIEKLMKQLGRDHVRQCDKLHAKVYLGRESAIITSANSSANGLGFEGPDSYWLEAGVLVTELSNIESWFEALWKNGSRGISEADLQFANDAWNSRPKRELKIKSFANFEINQNRLPWIVPETEVEWGYKRKNIEEQGYPFNNITKKRIDDGLEIEFREEFEIMKFRWFLFFDDSKFESNPDNFELGWSYVGTDAIRGGFYWNNDNKERDVILSDANSYYPFEIDPEFRQAFLEVINKSNFNQFMKIEKGEKWYKNREHLLKPFWNELKIKYMSLIQK